MSVLKPHKLLSPRLRWWFYFLVQMAYHIAQVHSARARRSPRTAQHMAEIGQREAGLQAILSFFRPAREEPKTRAGGAKRGDI